MRTTFFLTTVLCGLAAAKRGCKNDAEKGMGWYWVVLGDTLDEIAADFGETAQDIATRNGIANKDSIRAWTSIKVKCSTNV